MMMTRFLRLTLALAALLYSPILGRAQTVMPSPYQVALDNSGKIINNACIWTYAAGTTTAATTYNNADVAVGHENTNPIRSDSAGRFVAYLVNGLSYKFTYEAACVPPAHGSVLKTVDNVAAVPAGNVNIDVTGTAGQSLLANDVVFLSDGSRGNTAGSWYQADADFQDASVNALTIGMVPSAVASGATGTFRIQGRITGLSGLTPGTAYYASATAGAVTATQPLLGRFVGSADTTTTLVLTPNPKKDLIQPPSLASCGRLTLTTGTPVTSADVSAATSIYFAPYHCNRIALYDGTSEWNLRTFNEITISIAACTASKPYDVFMYDATGVVTAETLVWTNATTRATTLTLQNGIYVKTGATTRRYVGSYYCNASAGQTDNTLAKRLVFNEDNRVLCPLRRIDATATWTYNSATIRQANFTGVGTANQIEVMMGSVEDPVQLSLAVWATGTINDFPQVGIGVDSTTVFSTSAILPGARLGSANGVTAASAYVGYPGYGYHTLTWLEARSGAATVTFDGTNGAADTGGMVGLWRC